MEISQRTWLPLTNSEYHIHASNHEQNGGQNLCCLFGWFALFLFLPLPSDSFAFVDLCSLCVGAVALPKCSPLHGTSNHWPDAASVGGIKIVVPDMRIGQFPPKYHARNIPLQHACNRGSLWRKRAREHLSVQGTFCQ